jgi:hypothetical protein
MKAVFKILPLVIGCAILIGISNASASCSYVGVTTSTTASFTEIQTITNSSGSKTWVVIFDLKIDNVTASAINCKVGESWTRTSGNWTGPTLNQYSTTVVDATVMNSTLNRDIISVNIVNKTYYYYNDLGNGNYSRTLATWDSIGLILSYSYIHIWTGTHANYMSYTVERFSNGTTDPQPSTPPVDNLIDGFPPVAIIACILSSISYIITRLRRRCYRQ